MTNITSFYLKVSFIAGKIFSIFEWTCFRNEICFFFSFVCTCIYRIRPNKCTVCLDFFKITGKTCGKICRYLLFYRTMLDKLWVKMLVINIFSSSCTISALRLNGLK